MKRFLLIPLLCALAFGQGATVLKKTTVLAKTTVFAGAAASTPGYISGCSATAYGASMNCTIASVVAGNELVIAAYVGNGATATATDVCNTGGITDIYTSHSTGQSYYTFFTAAIGASTASCVITVSWTGSTTAAFYVHEVSNINTTTPVDNSQATAQYQYGPGTGANAVSSGNITTTKTNDYLFAATFDATGNNPASTAGTSFTLPVAGATCLTTAGGYPDGCSEYYVWSSSGSIAATFTAAANGGDTMLTGVIALEHP